MNAFAFVLAAVFAALAVRSAIYWARHRIDSDDMADEALFALFVTGRVGTWLLASGMFVVFGSISVVGRAYTDEARGFAWLFIVFLALGSLQLLGAWFLGARGAWRQGDETPEAGDEPRPPAR